MAFSLKQNNQLGTGSLVSPSGQLAGAYNYINPYDYETQYVPDLNDRLHLQKGNGRLLKFSTLMGSLKPFASDMVQHAELGELHEAHKGVVMAGDNFTTTTPHNLRPGETVMVSDGNKERQGVVTAITSSTVAVIKNKRVGVWGLTGTVTISQFSNVFGKGKGNFTQGREDNPIFIKNYPQIIKAFYKENESDMTSHVWVKAPQYPGGEGWFNTELQRTEDKYDNLIELTHLFHERAEAGSDAVAAGYQRGMKGIVQQIEERGNIGNESITDIEELSNIAFRVKQQGAARNYSWWTDHNQLAAFRRLMSGANAMYINGANYGHFANSPEMALKFGFTSADIDGVSFHVSELKVLDEPQLLGAENLRNTSIQSLMIPNGEKTVMESVNQRSLPYLTIRYRELGGLNRYKKTKFFGGAYGTDHKEDTFEMHCLTEMSNQVIGANQFFVFRRGTGVYTGV